MIYKLNKSDTPQKLYKAFINVPVLSMFINQAMPTQLQQMHLAKKNKSKVSKLFKGIANICIKNDKKKSQLEKQEIWEKSIY